MQFDKNKRSFLKGAAALAALSSFGGVANAEIRRRRTDFVFQPGQIDKPLIDKEGSELLVPASMTKIMTGLIAYEQMQAGNLDRKAPFRLSPNARKQPPVKYGGRSLSSNEDALNLMMTRSYNDVAAGLAEAVAGTEWSFYNDYMMPRARAIGMYDTKFYNASGLPIRGQGENLTTARDFGRLMEFISFSRPEFLDYMGHESYKDPRRGEVHNTNHLLEGATSAYASPVQGVFAGKTGIINASGSNLALWAERDGQTLIGIFTGFSGFRERNIYVAQKIEDAFAMIKPEVAVVAEPIIHP